MKIKPDIDITDFLLEVQKCSGDVFFETPEGDIMNLKSALSAYVFTAVYAHPDILDTGVVVFYDSGDAELLARFLR